MWLCPATIYYSIEREERETYRERRQAGTLAKREEREKAFGSGTNGFFGVRAGSPVPASS